MMWMLLAKLFDPVVILLGLIGGRLSGSWLVAVVIAGTLAFTVAILSALLGAYVDAAIFFGGALSAAFWTSVGFLVRRWTARHRA